VVARRFHWRRTGRRNSFLGGVSIIWLVYAWSLTQGPFIGGSGVRLWTNMGPFGDHLSTEWWTVVWAAAAIIGLIIAVRGVNDRRLKRSSIHRDAIGFNAILIPPLLWTILHAWSWVINVVDADLGNSRGWVSVCVWGVTVMAILIVAGWPEVEPDHDRDGDDVG
jgi:hypothetical protein